MGQPVFLETHDLADYWDLTERAFLLEEGRDLSYLLSVERTTSYEIRNDVPLAV
jgi:hypothetical protein